MPKHPDKFRASDCAGGLSVAVAEPLDHTASVQGGGSGVCVGGGGVGMLDEEVGEGFVADGGGG